MKDEHEQGYVYTELLDLYAYYGYVSGSAAFVLHDFKEAAVRKQFEDRRTGSSRSRLTKESE